MAKSIEDTIKELAIVALVSDDRLLEKLVLKGGNAIPYFDAAKPVRRSLDLDFSIDGDLGPIEEEREKLAHLLAGTFAPEGLAVFDVKLDEAPPDVREDLIGDFWGGYTLEFKVLRAQEFHRLADEPHKRRLRAIEAAPGGRRTFMIDMSKREACEGKMRRKLRGYTFYVYSPEMLVCEKIRAICQQMEEYRRMVASDSRRPRARDFFDIHLVSTQCDIELGGDEAWNQLTACFAAKHVPLRLLGRIWAEREFHRENFRSVRDTVEASVKLEDFDFYARYLVDAIQPLQARWEMDPPVG